MKLKQVWTAFVVLVLFIDFVACAASLNSFDHAFPKHAERFRNSSVVEERIPLWNQPFLQSLWQGEGASEGVAGSMSALVFVSNNNRLNLVDLAARQLTLQVNTSAILTTGYFEDGIIGGLFAHQNESSTAKSAVYGVARGAKGYVVFGLSMRTLNSLWHRLLPFTTSPPPSSGANVKILQVHPSGNLILWDNLDNGRNRISFFSPNYKLNQWQIDIPSAPLSVAVSPAGPWPIYLSTVDGDILLVDAEKGNYRILTNYTQVCSHTNSSVTQSVSLSICTAKALYVVCQGRAKTFALSLTTGQVLGHFKGRVLATMSKGAGDLIVVRLMAGEDDDDSQWLFAVKCQDSPQNNWPMRWKTPLTTIEDNMHNNNADNSSSSSKWTGLKGGYLWTIVSGMNDGDGMVYIHIMNDAIYGLALQHGALNWRYSLPSAAAVATGVAPLLRVAQVSGNSVVIAQTAAYVNSTVNTTTDWLIVLGSCNGNGISNPINNTCTCYRGHYGPSCSIYCIAEDSCSGRGTCDNVTGECICQPPYYGHRCSKLCNFPEPPEPSTTENSPCTHHGILEWQPVVIVGGVCMFGVLMIAVGGPLLCYLQKRKGQELAT